MQQALLAERATYTHRLFVLKRWAERRLITVSAVVAGAFAQFRDWVLLRRQKELDAVAGLVDVIKEHIESENLISARLTLEGAHLHRHPNVQLQVPTPKIVRPPLEVVVPFRWTIEQLDRLLDVVAGAACALVPGGRVLPTQSLLTLLVRLTSACGGDEAGVKEQAQVPECWRLCDIDRLQNLCNLFSHPDTGTVDCIEFLLHIGLLHSPSGWPSIETLTEVRTYLECNVPDGTSWPDFWITNETFAELPLFADKQGAEVALAEKYRASVGNDPETFDRPREQLLWVCRVLQRFCAPLRQWQAWQLEACWHDYLVRSTEDVERSVEMLDDAKSTSSISPHPPPTAMTPLLTPPPQTDTPAMGSCDASLDVAAVKPPPPRPLEPAGLPEPPEAGAISVRQFFTYLCQGESTEDGLTRALTVLGSKPKHGTAVPPIDLHAMLLQLGARPTPPSLEGDGRPPYASLEQFCEELDIRVQSVVLSAAKLATSSHAQRFGHQHCRKPLGKLFPKNSKKKSN